MSLSPITTPAQTRTARIRGSLERSEPGARGFEHYARNPSCILLAAATLAEVAPATIAGAVLHLPPREGQSPLALGTGTAFEHHLIEKNAAELMALFRQAHRLGIRDSKVENIVDRAPGASPFALARRKSLTRRLIRQKLAGDPAAPNIIIKPRLEIVLVGVPHDVEPDALIAADKDPFYRVAELKSYVDRAGKTDPSKIKGALRQAGVGIYALRELLRQEGVQDPAALASLDTDLVLRRPGSFHPTLREMHMPGEYHSVQRALQAAPQTLAAVEAELRRIGPDGALDDPRTIDALPINYRPDCREHCPLAPYCKRRAHAAGDPIVLGAQDRAFLAPAGSYWRALDLLNGAGGPPRSAEEATLGAQLRAADAAWKAAL